MFLKARKIDNFLHGVAYTAVVPNVPQTHNSANILDELMFMLYLQI